jgi:hypothetical protein
MKKMARLLEQALRSFFALLRWLRTAPRAPNRSGTPFGNKLTIVPTPQLAIG